MSHFSISVTPYIEQKGPSSGLSPQVTKFGRDAVLYVESLIESIMGGLEGLINILDSEGGFGALESQVRYPTQDQYHNISNLLLDYGPQTNG